MHSKILFFLVFQFSLLSCAPEMKDVIEEWTDKGWSKVRSHGTKKEFNRQSTLMSEKARAIEVSWIENGNRRTKLYQQDSHYYVALRFFCTDGDEFSVVMKKRK